MDPLLLASGTELARLIREGECRALEVVERHIERIQQVNPRLNAVVRDRFDIARQEAAEADALGRTAPAADLPPFHGVPCTIKESCALHGMPNSSGLVSRAAIVAEQDAPPVARLRAAGAIPLGVTNTSEVTCWPGADNRVYGRTSNAYDPDYQSGEARGARARSSAPAALPSGWGPTSGARSGSPPLRTASSVTSPRAAWCPAPASTRPTPGGFSATTPPGRWRAAPKT